MDTVNPIETKGTTGGNSANGSKYVTFFLGGEEYGLPILCVKEIIGMVSITPIPHAPDYFRGVINLRGSVIPVIDLRTRFSMPPGEESRDNCIIVVKTHGYESGIIVDRMSEVCLVREADIQLPPEFGVNAGSGLVRGIDKSQGRVRLLLDIERLVSGREIETAQAEVDQAMDV